MTKPATCLDSMLCFDVYATNLAFGRLYKPLLDRLGITYPQYLVLVILWEHGSLGVGEIGGLLGLESNTLTPLIKRLEAAGIVRRTRDPKDERKVQVSLTQEGRALQAEARGIPDCVAAATGMSSEEIVGLQALLERLQGALATGANGGSGMKGTGTAAKG